MDAIRTVGHGTLEAVTFAHLLRSAGIEVVVDVRRFPGSRRHPHFAAEPMARWLPEHGLGYRWVPALGGRRRATEVSPNVGLHNEQLRAYADYMASEDFARGVSELLEAAAAGPVAVMCAESVWWRCHRRLLADHLVLVEEVEVGHLFHDGRRQPHPVTREARRAGPAVIYDRVTERP